MPLDATIGFEATGMVYHVYRILTEGDGLPPAYHGGAPQPGSLRGLSGRRRMTTKIDSYKIAKLTYIGMLPA
ncbi:MAG: hypothetical protein QW837_06015 [Conexivisphaerales archaeon]